MKKFIESGIQTTLTFKFVDSVILINTFSALICCRDQHGDLLRAYKSFYDEVLLTPNGDDLVLYLPKVSNPETRVNIGPPYMAWFENLFALIDSDN
jgi:hypothetical protein